jgi:hypothetical protein
LQVSESSFSYTLFGFRFTGTNQVGQMGLARQTELPKECCRRALDSVTKRRANKTARSGETQQAEHRQYSDKQIRHHESLPLSPPYPQALQAT